MKFLSSIVLWLALPGAAPAVVQSSPVEIVKVAEGVYAALQPAANRFNESNSVIVVNDTDVLVVDAQSSPAKVRALIGEIRRITDKPVRYVVNTHWHGDHTQGDFVYREEFPEVEFVGHATLSEDVPGRAAPQLREDNQKLAAAIAEAEKRLAGEGDPLTDEERLDLQGRVERSKIRWADLESVRWIVPTLEVGEEFTLRRGSRSIRILHRPGHTRGDLILHLPQEKILVTGDLIDDLPYGGHGIPSQWLASLKSLEELEFDSMITGHGQIHRGKEHLRLITRLVQTIVEGAARAAGEGLDLEQAKKSVDLSSFREVLAKDDAASRAFDFFMDAAVERAYREAKGETLQ